MSKLQHPNNHNLWSLVLGESSGIVQGNGFSGFYFLNKGINSIFSVFVSCMDDDNFLRIKLLASFTAKF
jgi:hypothetical protein